VQFECSLHPFAALNVVHWKKAILAECLFHKVGAVRARQTDVVPPDRYHVRIRQFGAVWIVSGGISIGGAAIG
jgi:hypothetical protein